MMIMQCALHSDDLFTPQPMLKRGNVLGPVRTVAIGTYVLETIAPQVFIPSSRSSFRRIFDRLSLNNIGM
jgi:hypothetical protein